MGSFNLRRKASNRMSFLRRCIFRVWNQVFVCSLGKPVHYRMLPLPPIPLPPPSSSDNVGSPSPTSPTATGGIRDGSKDSDLVLLKISLLGDSQIGKSSFLAKYVGNEKEERRGMVKDGMNMMDKTLMVEGARISFSLWEIDGDEEGSKQQIPVACKDSVAILIMFDLTSRITLNGVIRWYQEARKWNQSAIPILIGTKFDDFIQLPMDMQFAIASQARSYAKALNATLFFSSANYNINVNKIFKFITAKLFDLPWTPQRNLTIGEPIIDF